MGIVSAIAHIIILAACIYAFAYTLTPAFKAEAGPWPGRVVGMLTLLFGVYLVNAYVVEIPSPFQAPLVEDLPARSPEPPKPTPLDLEAPKNDAGAPSASESHKMLLKEWSAQ